MWSDGPADLDGDSVSGEAVSGEDVSEAQELFDHYGARAHRAVLRAIPSGEPHRYLYDLLPVYPLRPSKCLRPVLCLAACAAFGGVIDDAMAVAVALELTHTAFLVHDDIQDQSPHRRGGPALHVSYGTPLALNVGDMLASLAGDHLIAAAERLPATVAEEILHEYQRIVRQTIEGQAMELGWQHDNAPDVTTTDYLRMVMKKTSWYSTIVPLRLGALIGSDGDADLGPLTSFGAYLGAMFQIANDLAGIGVPGHGGDDIREGKRTLPLIHLLNHGPRSDRQRLLAFLDLPRHQQRREDIDWVADALYASGSIDFGRSCLRAMTDVAHQHGVAACADLSPSPNRDLLLALPSILLHGDSQSDQFPPVTAPEPRHNGRTPAGGVR